MCRNCTKMYLLISLLAALAIIFACSGSGSRSSGSLNSSFYNIYTPSNPNPGTVASEESYYVKAKHWQIAVAGYKTGDSFVQVKPKTREDGNLKGKTKFSKLVANPGDNSEYLRDEYPWKAVPFHHDNVPIPKDWVRGEAPFSLSQEFSEYTFQRERDPGDEREVWTALVILPKPPEQEVEVVKPNYTPNDPKPSCGRNTPPNKSWERDEYYGLTFYQVDLRDDGINVKIKLNDWKEEDVVSFDCTKDTVPSGWQRGQRPFTVKELEDMFPGIKFEAGRPPENNGGNTKTIWAGLISL